MKQDLHRQVASSRTVRPAVLLRGFVALLLALAFALYFDPAAAQTYVLTGKVIRVSDGDSLTLRAGSQNHRIRLASIDAPETGHGKKRPGQPFGQTARRALAELLAGQEINAHCYEQDHYGRDICDIPLADGKTVSQTLVAMGLAWANMQGGGKYMRDSRLPELERNARAHKLGLWRAPDAVPPWEWRWKCWKALESGRTTPIC